MMSAPCRISPITRSVSPKRAAVQSASPCTSTTSKQKGTSDGSSLVADETGAYRKVAVFPRGLVHVKVQFTSVRAECAQGDAGDRDAVAHITEIAAYLCSVSQSHCYSPMFKVLTYVVLKRAAPVRSADPSDKPRFEQLAIGRGSLSVPRAWAQPDPPTRTDVGVGPAGACARAAASPGRPSGLGTTRTTGQVEVTRT